MMVRAIFTVPGIYLPLGQRIGGYTLSAGAHGYWREFASGQSIGSRRLIAGDRITADRIRLEVRSDRSNKICPALSEFAVYHGVELPWR